jgi:hypothetical protein
MATLSIRPRRTKANPFPRSIGLLARWRRDQVHVALRADGSVVRRVGGSTWTVITLPGRPTKGLTVEEVDRLLVDAGYTRESTP